MTSMLVLVALHDIKRVEAENHEGPQMEQKQVAQKRCPRHGGCP